MNHRLLETLIKNKNDIKDGVFVDVYNRSIRTDEICGAILVGIDYRNNSFIIVKDDANERNRASFVGRG